MNNSPQWRTLGECLELVIDNRGKTPPLSADPTEYELIEVNALKGDGKWPAYSEVRKFVDRDTYETWFRKGHPSPGDVLFSTVGSIAEVALSEGRGCIAQNVVGLRGKQNQTYGPYLYYALRNPMVKRQLLSLDISSVQPSIKVPHLMRVELPWPSYAAQKMIAHILGTLDDKIELNRQINTTLESMAQSLFKSWFVDFDPVIDNVLAAGNDIPEPLQTKAEQRKALGDKRKPLPDDLQQQFPDRFVFTEEMGWVPEGWPRGVLEDLIVLQRGFDLPKVKRTDGDYPLMVASGQDGTHNEFKVRGPGVTTGRSGKLGDVCLVLDDFWPLNTTLWIKEYKNSSPYHAYYLLKGLELARYNSGSAVPTLNRNHVHNIPVILPPAQLIDCYDTWVSPLYQRQALGELEVKQLGNLRDTLLPRLLSGELRISEAERQVVGAT